MRPSAAGPQRAPSLSQPEPGRVGLSLTADSGVHGRVPPGFQRVETIPGQIERWFSRPGRNASMCSTAPLELRAVFDESVLLRRGRQFGNGRTTWPADRSPAAPQRDVEILLLSNFFSLSLDSSFLSLARSVTLRYTTWSAPSTSQ